jgi:hypothetical protein
MSRRKQYTATAIFCMAVVLVIYHLLRIRWESPLPSWIYPLGLSVAIICLVFQLVKHKLPTSLLLAQILVLGSVLHLTYIIPNPGFSSSDALKAYKIMELSSSLLPTADGITEYADYPVMFMFGQIVSRMFSISLRELTIWLPSLLISPILLIVCYLLAQHITGSKRVALLVAFLASVTYYLTYEGSAYKQELFALIPALFSLYLALKGRMVLSIACIAIVLLTHHATPINLLATLIIIVIVLAIRRDRLRQLLIPTAILIVAIGSMWAFYDRSMYDGIRGFAIEITGQAPPSESRPIASNAVEHLTTEPRQFEEEQSSHFDANYKLDPTAITTIRGKATYWGFMLAHLLLLISLIHAMRYRKYKLPPVILALIWVLFGWGTWTIVQSTLVPADTPLVVGAWRLVMLGWLWGYIPLAFVIIKHPDRLAKVLATTGAVILVLVNVCQIDSVYWDYNSTGRRIGHIATAEDYRVAKLFQFNGNTAAFKQTRNAIYDIQGNYPYLLTDMRGKTIEELEWLVIKPDEYKAKLSQYGGTPAFIAVNEVMNGSASWEKVYEGDGIWVYKNKARAVR